MALSISMTTKLRPVSAWCFEFLGNTHIESEIVDAAFALSLENISQPISGNCDEHRWKWDYTDLVSILSSFKTSRDISPVARM